jgi:hypothetical protein
MTRCIAELQLSVCKQSHHIAMYGVTKLFNMEVLIRTVHTVSYITSQLCALTPSARVNSHYRESQVLSTGIQAFFTVFKQLRLAMVFSLFKHCTEYVSVT